MSYQEDLILSTIYGRGEPGLAMADPLPPPDKDPRQPRPDPSRPADSPYLPGKSPIPSKGLASAPNFPGGGFTTTSGAFVDMNGEAYYLDGGELIPEGGYDPAIHGDLIPHGGPDMRVMNQQMMIATDPSKISQPTEKGFFLDDGEGIYGHVYQNEGGYLKEGKMYDQGIHGLPVPLI